jgi:hypothetical protein
MVVDSDSVKLGLGKNGGNCFYINFYKQIIDLKPNCEMRRLSIKQIIDLKPNCEMRRLSIHRVINANESSIENRPKSLLQACIGL